MYKTIKIIKKYNAAQANQLLLMIDNLLYAHLKIYQKNIEIKPK